MWQWLMVLYINCASHAPGVKFGHAPGVDSLHRLTMGKTKKIFFSETKRPRASIFCMYQCLVVPIINCASHAPGSNSAMPRGSIVSMHRLSLVDSQLSLQCDNLSGELQDQWSSSYLLIFKLVRVAKLKFPTFSQSKSIANCSGQP